MSENTEQAANGTGQPTMNEPSDTDNSMTLEDGVSFSFDEPDEPEEADGPGEEEKETELEGNSDGEDGDSIGDPEPDGKNGDEQDDSPEPPKEEAKTFVIKAAGQDYEVTQEEAVQLAQKGIDYTLKTQEVSKLRQDLAEKAKALIPLERLAVRMNADPGFREHIMKYDIPTDPAERQQHEAAQKAASQLEQTYTPILESQQQQIQDMKRAMTVQQALDAYSKDEFFPDTVKLMQDELHNEFMHGQISAQQHDELLFRLDTDPEFFSQHYKSFRVLAERGKKAQAARPQEAEIKKAVERKAPLVESGKGNAADQNITARERTKKLLQNALDGSDAAIGGLY